MNEEKKDKSVLATLSSLLAGRAAFARKAAGLQYGGERDVYTAAGYPAEDKVDFGHYWGLYRRNELAKRVIELPVKTTWRTPPVITEDDRPDGTPFTEAFEALASRTRLWRSFARADTLAGVGNYAIMLIVQRGVPDGGLKTPLQRVTSPEDVSILVPYTQGSARIDDFDWTPGPHFGQVERYRVTLAGKTNRTSGARPDTGREVDVHWTRAIHVAEGKLEDEVFGTPRLECVLNRLFDLEKIAASTGESYWQLVMRVLQASLDENAEVTGELLDELEEALGEIVHDLRRQFISKGAKLEWVGGQVAPVKDIGEFYFSLIAAGTGIPRRILFGSERGELASKQDQANWFGVINERQEQFAEPEMIRPTIDRLITVGVLPPPETGDYNVVWPDLNEASEAEIAEGNLKNAQTAAALAGVGGDPAALVEITEEGRVYLVPRAPGEPMSEPDLPGGPEDEDDGPEIGRSEEEDENGDSGDEETEE